MKIFGSISHYDPVVALNLMSFMPSVADPLPFGYRLNELLHGISFVVYFLQLEPCVELQLYWVGTLNPYKALAIFFSHCSYFSLEGGRCFLKAPLTAG